MRRPALPLARRFHRQPGDRLRAWERVLFLALHSAQPERRLWANVLADGLYAIYRFRDKARVREALAWLNSGSRGSLIYFADLAPVFDIDPDDVRRDVARDMANGKTRSTEC